MEKLFSSAHSAATPAHATRRPRSSTVGLGAILVMAAPFAWSAPGHAQTDVAGQPSVSAQCVVRTFKDADGIDRPAKLVISSGEASDYAALGFTPTACGTIDVATYRDEVGKLAAFGNDAVQNRLTQVLGARPEKMCASAKLVAASVSSISDVSSTDPGTPSARTSDTPSTSASDAASSSAP